MHYAAEYENVLICSDTSRFQTLVISSETPLDNQNVGRVFYP
jgi:hypothetical protein